MKSKTLIAILVSALLLVTSYNVKAFQVVDNQTVDSHKTWTLKFTGDVGFDDLTKKSITVTDSKGKIVNVNLELSNDNKSILVKAPKNGYIEGETYTLNINKNVHGKNNKSMKQDRIIHFKINNPSGLETIMSAIDLPQNPNPEDNFIIIGKRRFEVGQFKQLMAGYEDKIDKMLNCISDGYIGTGGICNGNRDMIDAEFGISVHKPSNINSLGDVYIGCSFWSDGRKVVSLGNIRGLNEEEYNNFLKAIYNYFYDSSEKHAFIFEDLAQANRQINEESIKYKDNIQTAIYDKTTKMISNKKITFGYGVDCYLTIAVVEGKVHESIDLWFK